MSHRYTYTATASNQPLRLGATTEAAQERGVKGVAIVYIYIIVGALSAHTMEC